MVNKVENNKLNVYDRDSHSLIALTFNGLGLRTIDKFSDSYLPEYMGKFEFSYNIYYFSHWSTIYAIDFDNGNQTQGLQLSNPESLFRPKFRIIDKSLQSDSMSLCSNADCSQLCLPINKTNYRCVCSERNFLCETKVSLKYLNYLYLALFSIFHF